MRSFKILLGLLVISIAAQTQVFNYSLENTWHEVPQKHTVLPQFDSAAAVGILDERNIEYIVEGKDIAMYHSFHQIVKINTDAGIEMFNKIYIPLALNVLLTNVKARAVLSNGKIITVPADKFKEITENGNKYQLFAMEGLEKGAEVEYTYTLKKNTTFFGMEVFQTSSIPKQKVVFTLSVPSHLKFDAKGYNGFKMSADSLIGDKRITVGYDENVPALEDEKYAVKSPYAKRVEYKLSYNLSSNPKVRMYTWKDFAKRAYTNYTTVSPKDVKPLNSFLTKLKLDDAASELKKIIQVENFIKTSINVDKALIGEEVSSIEYAYKNRSTDMFGNIRLYAALFEKAGINFQIVFAGRRDEYPLDEELENWNRIDETIFFFPNTVKYLSPSNIELRYPYIPPYWAGTKGLFLKGTTIGEFKTAIGSFNEVEMEPFDQQSHNMEVSIKFNDALDTLIIHSKQMLTGYGAADIRPIYAFLPKDKQDQANIEIIKSVAGSTDIKNIKVENEELIHFADNKPYSIAADIKSSELIETAGNKVLLKIGEIIGPQVEMYQVKPRPLPIELPYPHVLNRIITLEIPKGYRIKNLTDLNISIEHKDDNQMTMGFVSGYQQSGDVVNINIYETYKKMYYPISQFEDFKKVINASADFNKVVLVLEKI